jgi:hypothetical protein
VQDLQREYLKIEAQIKLAKGGAEDSSACLAAGRYYCFLKGEWEKGLPMLARSQDPKLRPLALKELAAEQTPASEMEIGQGWSRLAEREIGKIRENLKKRALKWLESAVPGLSGISKAEIENKIISLLFGGKAQIWDTRGQQSGVPLGGDKHNVSGDFTVELWFLTQERTGGLLTKRQNDMESSLTIFLKDGHPAVIGDGPGHRVDGVAATQVNDGAWHHLAAVKTDTRVRLFVDGKPSADIEIRPAYKSGSAWILGFHRPWLKAYRYRGLEGNFALIRLSRIARYSERFSPRGDYSSDRDTLFMR